MVEIPIIHMQNKSPLVNTVETNRCRLCVEFNFLFFRFDFGVDVCWRAKTKTEEKNKPMD